MARRGLLNEADRKQLFEAPVDDASLIRLYSLRDDDRDFILSMLEPLIGDTVDTAAILGQWTELMRLKASIETGAVVPSVILRKLAATGAGNVLSRALRALGRIERTLFTLQ